MELTPPKADQPLAGDRRWRHKHWLILRQKLKIDKF